MNVSSNFRKIGFSILGSSLLLSGVANATSKPQKTNEIKSLPTTYDVSYYTQNFATKNTQFDKLVTPKGCILPEVLKTAPSAKVKVNGEDVFARIVVSLSRNILFKYDANGKPIAAYKVATGKQSTPTHEGLHVVSHKEFYPYKQAWDGANRKKKPWIYGPMILFMKLVQNDGTLVENGEYIHGTNDVKSLGKSVSHGCIRMDNSVIKNVAKDITKKEYVLFVK